MGKIKLSRFVASSYCFQKEKKIPTGLFGFFTKTVTETTTLTLKKEFQLSVPHIGFTYTQKIDGKLVSSGTIYIPQIILEEKLSYPEQLPDGLGIYVEWSEKLRSGSNVLHIALFELITKGPTQIKRSLALKFDDDNNLREIQICNIAGDQKEELFVVKESTHQRQKASEIEVTAAQTRFNDRYSF